MGALTEVYIDPSIAGDSGAGTIGDPYGDLQYAADNQSRDSTNGDRFNVKAGTAEVLAAELDLSTYGTPTATAPLLIQGYTSAAGDGGQGEIDGNAGNFTVNATTKNYVSFRDMKIGNTGSATILTLGTAGALVNCEIHTCTHADYLITTNYAINFVAGNNIYNCSGSFRLYGGAVSFGNYFLTGPTNNFIYAIRWSGDASAPCFINRNIITVTGGGYGILRDNNGAFISNNSILSSSGTGVGIYAGSSGETHYTFNNLIEGFSGAGGVGITPGTGNANFLYNNGIFNCTTEISSVDVNISNDNESLSVSPFAKSGSNTFANRYTYFAPVDTGNVKDGAFVG